MARGHSEQYARWWPVMGQVLAMAGRCEAGLELVRTLDVARTSVLTRPIITPVP